MTYLYYLYICLFMVICPIYTNYEYIKEYPAITIVIHGVWFPFISSVIHKMDCPVGLTPGDKLGKKYTLGKIGKILQQAAPQDYASHRTFIFGWSGTLGFGAREQAAQELYTHIKDYQGAITIIAHSHGCNVALNLAKIAKINNNTALSIEKLILLAGPVQIATEQYVNSPVFKQVFSFYSKKDLAQIIDPQGIYKQTKQIARGKKTSFFSRRVFNSPKVLQAQILLDYKDPKHNDFLYKQFLQKLPLLIKSLEQIASCIDTKTVGCHALINISKKEQAPVAEIIKLKKGDHF